MDEPAVNVKGLSKVYQDKGRGQVSAVDGIEFEAPTGGILGLLGINGAGKTTTLRMLSTVLKPTSGTAEILGRDVIREPAEVRRNLGFLSATTGLHPRLTAREIIGFFARINGYPKNRIKDRVEELVERFGISEYADTWVKKLSSGMKQKVSIARTIAHDPPVLIFDEPTVGLDVLAANDMLMVIQALRDEGKTILYSTHIMREAEKICDSISIIHQGRIVVSDNLKGLREKTGKRYLEDVFIHYVGQAGE